MNVVLDTQWMVGFIDGEGCFHVGIKKQKEMDFGFQFIPEFTLVQDKKDIQILYRLKKFFQCGVVRHFKENRWCYRIQNQKHLKNILLPFFEKHPLKTKKQLDFLKFRTILLLMDSKEHSKKEGFEKIQKIQKTMRKESIR